MISGWEVSHRWPAVLSPNRSILAYAPLIRCEYISLPPSLPPFFPPSLPPSLTHSLTHSLTPSLPPSLFCDVISIYRYLSLAVLSLSLAISRYLSYYDESPATLDRSIVRRTHSREPPTALISRSGRVQSTIIVATIPPSSISDMKL